MVFPRIFRIVLGERIFGRCIEQWEVTKYDSENSISMRAAGARARNARTIRGDEEE